MGHYAYPHPPARPQRSGVSADDPRQVVGRLIDGRWNKDANTVSSTGQFVRESSAFRHWITADGSPGPTGHGGFRAEAQRYHLYVSLACPWAHRTLIVRKLKGLEHSISASVVHWLMRDDGWAFDEGPGVIPDPAYRARFLHQIYSAVDPEYTGRVTVPVLYDKVSRTIVNNESSDIIRMFNSAFVGADDATLDLYPSRLRRDIDEVNELVYVSINNGVYQAGFAKSQTAYESAVTSLFDALGYLEQRLAAQRYLCGDQLTEADIRLFTTLVRFDAVYVSHFKCNLRRLVDHPNLWAYTRDLYQHPGMGDTVNMYHIKHHYYESHRHINPTGIVPVGPEINFAAPVHR